MLVLLTTTLLVLTPLNESAAMSPFVTVSGYGLSIKAELSLSIERGIQVFGVKELTTSWPLPPREVPYRIEAYVRLNDKHDYG